ncbi:MAG: hypothetical protein HQM06_09210 [Magnetococcales bacterium]|nr:hypothetical protein [Magnetococcales bacterium]
MPDAETPFTLRHAHPLWLAQAPAPEALDQILAAVKQLTELDDHVGSLLDYAYRVRVSRLLRNHADAEEFDTLNRHLLRMIHPLRAAKFNALDKPYAVRWQTLSDLLEDRLSILETAIPEAIKNRRHVPEILQLLRERGQLSQSQVAAAFPQIGPSNLSRLMSQLEGWELVLRQRYKKEKIITLGPRAHEALPDYDPLASGVGESAAEIQTRRIIKNVQEGLIRNAKKFSIPSVAEEVTY